MEYGYIVLAGTRTGFFPNAIKWFTRSRFSHSLVTMPTILGLPICIEAADSGVNTVRFDKAYSHNTEQEYEIWKLNIAPEAIDAGIREVVDDLETAYGFLEYPWFVWRSICRVFGKDIKHQDNWCTRGTICSELCVAFLKACGLGHTLAGYGEGSVSPQDLQDIFKAHPAVFELVAYKKHGVKAET